MTNALVLASPSTTHRTALFGDSPLSEHLVPGTLHHTTDEHIERLAARAGAVALIRQLAQDLAQRDAQMSALQRRAEEREKILRKMLLECEVSNMDIEARLHRTMARDESRGSAKSAKIADGEESTTSSLEGSIDGMMNQAMADTVGDEAGGHTVSWLSSRGNEGLQQATVRVAVGANATDDYTRFLGSGKSNVARQRGTSRGWKDYLWISSGTSRKSSGASSVLGEPEADPGATAKPRVPGTIAPRRKGLQTDLFRPPDDTASERPASRETDDGRGHVAHSRSRSTSVAAWAVKLVAGNPRPLSDIEPVTKGKELAGYETSSHIRRASTASGSAAESAEAALRKINETRIVGPKPRRVPPSIPVGTGGTLRATTSGIFSNSAASPTTSVAVNSPITSGPVEMDAIIPPDTQPPTLNSTYNYYHPTDFVTDRFGFIYDQRRRLRNKDNVDKKNVEVEAYRTTEMLSPARDSFGGRNNENEAVDVRDLSPSDSRSVSPASNEEEEMEQKATKGWQDYLKIATFPTELLSHTPAGGRMSDGQSFDTETAVRLPQITVADHGTLLPASLNPQPSASTVVANNATFAKTSTIEATSAALKRLQQEPVKMLLEQLNELHDSLQRERTIRWNEFLRKVRAERQREGELANAPDGRLDLRLMPEATLTDGEVIGVAGLGNKGRIGRAKWKEFKQLVLNGIPVTYRAKVWAECSGASALRTPGYYDDLVKNGTDDPVIVGQIAMDINRTLTDNVFFRDGPGVTKLNEVLIAYSRRNPSIGYCQGMNLIAGSLLLIMPTAEDAFWLLTSMIENILPANYYDDSLLASRADQQVLRQYVSQILPRLSNHLDSLNIELEAFTFQWFLSVFTGCLCAEALFRVWDVVLCTNDGSTFLFQVALALLSLNEKALLECKTPAGVYSYINQQMTNHAISIDGLIHASEALKKVVTRAEIEERRAQVIQHEKETMRKRAEMTIIKARNQAREEGDEMTAASV